jgi:hypothetical protein
MPVVAILVKQEPMRPHEWRRFSRTVRVLTFRPMLGKPPKRSRLSTFPPDHQPRFPIYLIHPLVHMLARAAQQNMQPPIPEARLLPRQLHQTRARWFIAVRRLVAVTRDRHRPQSARSRLAEGILRSHLPDGCLQCYQFQRFLPITDCKAFLSKLRSTISFRSFVYASHYCFAPYAWLTSFPLHFAFPA